MAKHSKQTIKDVSLDLIDEPKGIIRMDIDPQGIDELVQSISEIGLLQPILIAVDGERFEVVFGHRRYLASKKLGLSSIKAIIRTMTQEEIGIARATENISRADLTPLEEAATYLNLIEQYGYTVTMNITIALYALSTIIFYAFFRKAERKTSSDPRWVIVRENLS